MEDECTCEDGHDPHPCPFAQAVEQEQEWTEDEDDYCDCCPYCTEKCAMDI